MLRRIVQAATGKPRPEKRLNGGSMRKAAWLVFVLAVSLTASAERSVGKPGSGLAASPAGEEQRPAHPATVAQVREIMELTGGENVKQQMLDGLLPHMAEMLPYLPQDVVADIRQSLEIADFDAAVVRSYQAHLSTEDAAQIIAFFHTAAGKRMVGTFPEIQSEGQQAGAELGQQVMLEVIQRHQDEIQTAKQKYQKEHAEAAPAQ
jgi:hypothetical protein